MILKKWIKEINRLHAPDIISYKIAIEKLLEWKIFEKEFANQTGFAGFKALLESELKNRGW